MNNSQQELKDLARREYAAPDYCRLTFETSGLAQMSGKDGNIGDAEDVSTTENDPNNDGFDW